MADNEPVRTGDSFTDAILEDSRLRRQTGTDTPSRDIDYLNTPPLRKRMEGARESTNVEDRRGEPFLDRGGLEDAIRGGAQQFVGISPLASPDRVKKAWDTVTEVGKGFMEDVNMTLQALVNPSQGVTAEPGTEDRYAQEILARRAQGRAAARVGMDLAAGGMSRAVGASEAAVGSAGGRTMARELPELQNPRIPAIKHDDITIEFRAPHGGPDREFVVRGPDGKRGDGSLWFNSRGEPEIASIDLSGMGTRKGYGTKVYDALSKKFGDIVPSDYLTQDSMNFWQKRSKDFNPNEYMKEIVDGQAQYTRMSARLREVLQAAE